MQLHNSHYIMILTYMKYNVWSFFSGFRQGKMDESIKYLQKYIQVSEDSGDDAALSHACNSLGIRLNSLVCIVILLIPVQLL